MTLPHGYVKWFEELAVDQRTELGLGPLAPLDPFALATNLGIEVLPLSALQEAAPAAVGQFSGSGSGAFSAMTVFMGRERTIVHNDSHGPARRASNVAHEIAHGLLLHEPRPALDGAGCRNWEDGIEEQAQRLAGSLLIPRRAAFLAARAGESAASLGERYGVSEQMARWRMNLSGRRRTGRPDDHDARRAMHSSTQDRSRARLSKAQTPT